MWRNYLTIAVRVLLRHPTYAVINIAGLTLGLAACLLLALFVRYELGYDAALPGAERAFQLQQWRTVEQPGDWPGTTMTSYVSGTALAKDFPQVDRRVYVSNVQPVILQDGVPSSDESFVYVDGPLFDIVQLPFLRGDRATALSRPGDMVLTASEARRRFGDADPLGRTLTVVASGKSTDYRITGIVADPVHSHIKLSIVARFDPQAAFAAAPEVLTEWMLKNGWVYVRLREPGDAATIAAQKSAWEKRNIPDSMEGDERFNPGENNDWTLVNIRDIHLGEVQDSAMTPGNDRQSIATFAVIAMLILGIAVINFVNLSTARASMRAREVALRKVVGASKRQLVVQFLGEAVLITAASMILALALAEGALPWFNDFLGTSMTLAYGGKDGLLPAITGLALAIGLVSGLYPAFYLSRFRPGAVLRSSRSAAEAPGAGRFRGALVLAQFAVAIGLIVCTMVVTAQTEFARTTDPGYRRDGLLQIGNISRRAIQPVADTIEAEIARLDGVVATGRWTIGVATWGMENMTVTAPGASEAVEMNLYRVDDGFFPAAGVRTLAGRGFDAARAMDDSTVDFLADDPSPAYAALARRGYNVVVSAEAARRLGFRTPADAVGKTLKADDGDVQANGQTPATIVGVTADARFRSVRDPVEPMMFLHDRLQPSWLLVRYAGDPAEIRAAAERVWKRLAPVVPFEAEFSEDIVRELYDAEEGRARIFAGFALLAVTIACLGLFGLAAFTAERRTNEIGIRKVFGASVADIVRLLAWQFAKPVVVANLIAWPVAWWVMRDWLNGFDARIQLGPEPFVVAGLTALVIAVGTIAGHALKVARANPIHALRYE